jgi:hypothetical protein
MITWEMTYNSLFIGNNFKRVSESQVRGEVAGEDRFFEKKNN